MQIVNQSEYAKALLKNRAGLATDHAVSGAILQTIHDLLVQGSTRSSPDETALEEIISRDNPLETTRRYLQARTPGSVDFVMFGESHTSQQDRNRAQEILQAVNDQQLRPGLLVFERGMRDVYPTRGYEGSIIREENLTTVEGGNFAVQNGLSARQRSMIVGGFLALTLGGGQPSEADSCMIFFGENHEDILQHYRYYARHSGASHLLNRKTRALVFRSSV